MQLYLQYLQFAFPSETHGGLHDVSQCNQQNKTSDRQTLHSHCKSGF